MQMAISHTLGPRIKSAKVLICWTSLPAKGTMTAAEILLGLAILYAIVALIWLRRQDE